VIPLLLTKNMEQLSRKMRDNFLRRLLASVRYVGEDAPPRPTGAITQMNFLIGIAGNPPRADKSAMGAINRPLQMAGTLICGVTPSPPVEAC
jgi:hypothetical protein